MLPLHRASGQILRTRKLDDGWQFEAFDDKNATDDTTLDGAVIAVIRQL